MLGSNGASSICSSPIEMSGGRMSSSSSSSNMSGMAAMAASGEGCTADEEADVDVDAEEAELLLPTLQMEGRLIQDIVLRLPE